MFDKIDSMSKKRKMEADGNQWPLEWVLSEIARSDDKIQSYLRAYERQLTIIVSIATLGLGLGLSAGRRGVLLFLPLAIHLLGHYGNRLGIELFAVAGYRSYLHQTMGWDEPMARIAGAVIHTSKSDKTYNRFGNLAMILFTAASLVLAWPAYSMTWFHRLLFFCIAGSTLISMTLLRVNARRNFGGYDAAIAVARSRKIDHGGRAIWILLAVLVWALLRKQPFARN